MRKALVMVLLLAMAACGGGTEVSEEEAERLEHGRAVIAALADEDLERESSLLDPTLRANMPSLVSAWSQITTALGPLQSEDGYRTERVQQAGRDFDVIFFRCTFEGGIRDVQLTFDESNLVAGMFFVQSLDEGAYR